jgi:hypothetical protein
MNRLCMLMSSLLFVGHIFAQAPQIIGYQAVIRNAQDSLLRDQQIGIQISLMQGWVTGDEVYVESQITSTNINGLITIQIGTGTQISGSLNGVDWSDGPYFLNTAIDPTGGTNYTITGTSQLLSVPYALHANTADSIAGGVLMEETDPLFSTSIAAGITPTDTAKWNNQQELPLGGTSGQILSTNGVGSYSWIDVTAGVSVNDAIIDGVTVIAPSQNAVFDALILKAPIASPTFTGTVSGITKAMVGLTNVDDTSDADKPVSAATQTALDLKAPLTSPTFTGIPLAPTPGAATDDTQIATTSFVQTVAAAADNQTATEVASTATGAIASTNVQAALAEIDNEKLALAGGTMTGALAMSSQDISGVGTVTANSFSGTWEGNTLPVDKGGTGAINLTGYVKANGALAMTAATTIPSTDVTGLITKVNGSLPDGAGNVTVLMGNVTTGTLAARPGIAGTNGNIYVVSGDVDPNNDGRTYISDGAAWKEVSSNQAATDARYLQLAGGTLSGDVVVPTTKKITLTDAPNSTTDAANKGYVDTQVAAVVADQIVDATTTIAPSQNAVFDALILKAPIASPTFTGTVSGVTSAMVGLGNLDNTSDANKPVSTATQTALDLKENIANKSIDVALADNSNVKFPTELAVKTYVDNATAAINTLANGKIYLGNTSNVATEVTMSGDVTINNAGLTAIGASKVLTGNILDAVSLQTNVYQR